MPCGREILQFYAASDHCIIDSELKKLEGLNRQITLSQKPHGLGSKNFF